MTTRDRKVKGFKMKTFLKYICTAIYFFIIIITMNAFLSDQKVIYYIITPPLLLVGVIVIDYIIKKAFKNKSH